MPIDRRKIITHAVYGEPLTRDREPLGLSRGKSAVVSARVTLATREALRQHALRRGEAESQTLRRVIALALTHAGDAMLPAVIAALKLPDDSDAASILEAVRALLGESSGAAGAKGDALTDSAAATPSELRALAKMTPEQQTKFKALRAAKRK